MVRRLLLLGAALLLAGQCVASSIGIGVGIGIGGAGSGAGVPALGNLTGSLTAGAAAGTAVLTPTISGLTGCSWTITPATNFSQSSSTGLISTTSTATTVGTYTPTTKCTATSGGQTLTVAAALSIVANAGSYTPSLNFSDARNSMYL